ncbi:MAG: GNAT family N-acetyltransferase [Spirochaetales bacterium]|nr:GNAT family N-acetyltransferase [Candidatus Physcosoma equi]
MLRKALETEISYLTKLSEKAFLSDVPLGSRGGGPNGWKSEEWHRKQWLEGDLYAFLLDDHLAGGCVLHEKEDSLFIHRVFLDPDFHGKGNGLLLMKEIEESFPSVSLFTLDTPDWNSRTNQFYQKCGYRETGRKADPVGWFQLVYYEKILER